MLQHVHSATTTSFSLMLNIHIYSSYTGNNKINWIECVWTWLTPRESLKIIVKIYKLMSLFSASILSTLPLFYLILENVLIARGIASTAADDIEICDMYVYFWGGMKAWMARAMQNLWISKKHLPQKPIERER